MSKKYQKKLLLFFIFKKIQSCCNRKKYLIDCLQFVNLNSRGALESNFPEHILKSK